MKVKNNIYPSSLSLSCHMYMRMHIYIYIQIYRYIYWTCSFMFYVELSSLWTANNTAFCLFWFLCSSYGKRITQYFVSCFILHQLGTVNNAVFCLFCFLSSPLCCFKNYFTLCLSIFSNVMEKFDCNLKCPFFLHINFPTALNDQKM